MFLVVQNVEGQKISCSWERHQNKMLIGKQIGTSSKREHAKSKCKAQQDKCTGIVEFGPNNFSVSFSNFDRQKISETSIFEFQDGTLSISMVVYFYVPYDRAVKIFH